MADVARTLSKQPILNFESPHTQMSALKVSRKQDHDLAIQHQKQQPPSHQVVEMEEEEEEEIHEVASGSEEDYDEEENKFELGKWKQI